MIAPTFADVLLNDAIVSTIGVPEMRRGWFSTGERNTSRFVCDPVGLLIIVFSDWFERSVSEPRGERAARADAQVPGDRRGRAAAQVDVRLDRPRKRPVGVILEDVRRRLDHRPGLAHDPVRDALEPVVEPAVDRRDPLRAAEVERIDVAGLREPDLARHVVRREAFPPLAEVIRLHVVVVQAVRGEHRGLDVVDVVVVVALVPEVVDVARRVAVDQAHRVARREAGGVVRRRHDAEVRRVRVRGDRARQAGRVVRAGVLPDPVRARVVVPGGDRRDRHDRGQALDARGGDAVRERAVVRLAEHRVLAVVPVRDDGRVARRAAVVAGDAAAEPVDDGLEARDVAGPAVHRAAGRPGRSDRLRGDERVPARDEVVVVEERELVREAGGGAVQELGLVPAPDRRVVRARVDDRGHLHAQRRLLRTDDVDGHPVGDAVAVLVDARDRDPHPLPDRVCVAEDGLRNAVGDDDRRRIGRKWRRPARQARPQTIASTATSRAPLSALMSSLPGDVRQRKSGPFYHFPPRSPSSASQAACPRRRARVEWLLRFARQLHRRRSERISGDNQGRKP